MGEVSRKIAQFSYSLSRLDTSFHYLGFSTSHPYFSTKCTRSVGVDLFGLTISETIVGSTSSFTHLSSSLSIWVFFSSGIPWHFPSSSMNLSPVNSDSERTHCLPVLRSAVSSPFKSPQRPVALFLKTSSLVLTINLSPSQSTSTPYL